jgi:hypothetical protein
VSKIERLEDEVRALSTEELAAFREWFREFDSDAWERQIGADASAGRLDSLAHKALRAHRAGKSTPL